MCVFVCAHVCAGVHTGVHAWIWRPVVNLSCDEPSNLAFESRILKNMELTKWTMLTGKQTPEV